MAATQAEVDQVAVAYERAKEANEYVATLVVEMQLNSGEDYTMVWDS